MKISREMETDTRDRDCLYTCESNEMGDHEMGFLKTGVPPRELEGTMSESVGKSFECTHEVRHENSGGYITHDAE